MLWHEVMSPSPTPATVAVGHVCCRALRSLSCESFSFRTLTVKLSDHLGLHSSDEPVAESRCILTSGPVPLVVPRIISDAFDVTLLAHISGVSQLVPKKQP